MPDPAADLAAKLVTLSPVGGVALVLATNLFSGLEPTEDEAAPSPHRVTLTNYGGPGPEPYLGTGLSLYTGNVQLRLRSAPENFAAGEAFARALLAALHTAAVSGYVTVLAQDSQPTPVGPDASNRDVWSIDFQLRWTG